MGAHHSAFPRCSATLGSHRSVVDAVAAGLLRLRDRVAGRPPVALVVVTGTEYSFTRPSRRP
jgi:hypothetical protein